MSTAEYYETEIDKIKEAKNIQEATEIEEDSSSMMSQSVEETSTCLDEVQADADKLSAMIADLETHMGTMLAKQLSAILGTIVSDLTTAIVYCKANGFASHITFLTEELSLLTQILKFIKTLADLLKKIAALFAEIGVLIFYLAQLPLILAMKIIQLLEEEVERAKEKLLSALEDDPPRGLVKDARESLAAAESALTAARLVPGV